jgi:hypothetical protein
VERKREEELLGQEERKGENSHDGLSNDCRECARDPQLDVTENNKKCLVCNHTVIMMIFAVVQPARQGKARQSKTGSHLKTHFIPPW